MGYHRAVLATTHVDLDNEVMPLAVLQRIEEQIKGEYIPIGSEHDPRIPPLGRIVSAFVEALPDGHHRLVGVIEFFGADTTPEGVDVTGRELALREPETQRLYVSYDRSYQDAEAQLRLRKLNRIISDDPEPRQEIKKSIDPVSIIQIGGVFVLGSMASGFLQKVGADAWDAFRRSLKRVLELRRDDQSEGLLQLLFAIDRDGQRCNVELILTNPSDEDIERVLDAGLRELDEIILPYVSCRTDIRRLVAEYTDRGVEVRFGVTRSGIPLAALPLHEEEAGSDGA